MPLSLAKSIERRYGALGVPVDVVLPGGERVRLSKRPEAEIAARSVRGLGALARPALGRLARAYVHGDIDFTGSARKIIGIAERMVGTVEHGRTSVGERVASWLHQRRANRANISHHYDVGDAFYRLWLDERMVYSCAYFRHEDDTLDVAQAQKLDHVCRKLRLAPGERFLDIWCGWGGLIFWAAERYGVRATGITLSQNQADNVAAEIRRRGLGDRVRVELRDYLDLPDEPCYEKIASIGMFEHVGVARLSTYFGKIRRLLVPGGFVLNHGITHGMEGTAALGSGIGDFVEDYVFPGGELTHVARVISAMSTAGLEVVDAEALREHYAKTLWHWTDRLEANADLARREAGEARFRVWRVYMAGSAHAFERGWLSLWQLLAGRPFDDGHLPHPLTRDYMYGSRVG
jgi:cyclopropane-fatty-acyl-phospholipid synthase